MAIYDRRPGINTSKWLPVVVCLDVSRMYQERGVPINLLDDVVWKLLKALRQTYFVKCAHCEVAFLASGIVVQGNCGFSDISTLLRPEFLFTDDKSEILAQSVIAAIEKIIDRRKQLEAMEIPYGPSLLIVITDGKSAKTEDTFLYNNAILLLNKYCGINTPRNELIFPFLINIGNEKNQECGEQFLREDIKECLCFSNVEKAIDKIDDLDRRIHYLLRSDLHSVDTFHILQLWMHENFFE